MGYTCVLSHTEKWTESGFIKSITLGDGRNGKVEATYFQMKKLRPKELRGCPRSHRERIEGPGQGHGKIND